MATEKRLIDANALLRIFNPKAWNNAYIESATVVGEISVCPTVEAVEVSRLGRLGKLMMPYEGCPRGKIGPSGSTGDSSDQTFEVTELDAISDVDGNRWVPVLDTDLEMLKGVEVVHGRWVDRYGEKYANHLYECSECHKKAAYKFEDDSLHIGLWVQDLTDYCPNCGASMRDGDGDG